MRQFITVLLLLSSFSVWAQEAQFSQYFASGSLMNPAFSGTIPTINFNANYKQGGDANNEAYLELMQGTFTYPIRKVTSVVQQVGSAGVTFFRERRGFQGLFRTQKVLLNGAYTIELSELTNQMLIFGLQGGLMQHDITTDDFQWGSQYNRYIGYDNTKSGENISAQTLRYPVFNFGVIYTTYDNQDYNVRDYSFSAGLSVDNLNQPKISVIGSDDARKAFLYKGFVTMEFPLGSRFNAYPSAYAINSNGSFQINAGMYLSTYVSSAHSNLAILFQTGAWYRVGDSIIALVGFQMDNYRVGFSLDLNASDITVEQDLGANVPAFEVSLGYNFELSRPQRRISSPIF